MSFEIFTLIIGWKLVGYRVMECGSSFKQGDYRLVEVLFGEMAQHIVILDPEEELGLSLGLTGV
ncbi:TPA: hypothetical protein VJE56_001536 [Streptococcus pyogenes]|uniref:hypothetical protein n=1 Tax=Streptococcus pyogenes TaxID=1314 RepID=UPI001E359143|nr:hypothetical protein [Streptococcus pyogenes]UEN87839.1 hypothetical protein H7792_00595 [Streptococcus pyogenes]HEP1542905.1 hypothetical protein [Streptococcus pyogenes]HEQ3171368.1 hypothetical protein [Streptococcus pyogenes]HER0857796.1 hypothetical protein [Streptococcus pyogenes]HER0862814.1 hypothetical protein [Streptococcus pyogenes]